MNIEAGNIDPAVWQYIWQKDFDLDKEMAYHVSTRRPLYDLLNKGIASFSAPGGANVLEIGCGTAIDSSITACANLGKAKFFCSDFFLSALQLAGKISALRKAPLRLAASDAQRICFKDNSFDLVFSQGVLEHFRDVSPLMKEQVRVLKKGGILIIDVPQTYTICTLVKHYKIKKGRWPYGWETQFSYPDLLRLGKRYGLRSIGVCGHEYDSYVRFFNMALLRNIIKRLQAISPLRERNIFKKIDASYDRLWGILEKKWGHYFLINIAVAFKKE
ncbi:MAG: class I SAM-dependent methyltransferase [Candidatus Omnitrophica bacterium]|nr:class I SAM-dependent methyltransferase [Candidatus Omnitrophota bacterium]